jgi:hypothetical protein
MTYHHWISNLFGFNFVVEYCSGHLNSMVDVLSCCGSNSMATVINPDSKFATTELLALSVPSFRLLEDIHVATEDDAEGDHITAAGGFLAPRMLGLEHHTHRPLVHF